MEMILQKFIAASGEYSRREAEALIHAGRVTVNGARAELGMKASEDDDVRAEGKRVILAKEKIYIILNKPQGYVCSNRRFQGEKNVFDLMGALGRPGLTPPAGRGLVIAGRLDKDSRGLVLLTNDGDLAYRLTHPKFGHEKTYLVKSRKYKVESDGGISANELVSRMLDGVDIGDDDGIVTAKLVKHLDDARFEVVLTEGKKRQIRRMFDVLGFAVEDLQRTSIGPIKLGNLPEGRWRHLSEKELEQLRIKN